MSGESRAAGGGWGSWNPRSSLIVVYQEWVEGLIVVARVTGMLQSTTVVCWWGSPDFNCWTVVPGILAISDPCNSLF